MKNIYTSATKIVFILIAISLIALTWVGKIDPKDFFALAMVVFYHYYNKGTNPPQGNQFYTASSNG